MAAILAHTELVRNALSEPWRSALSAEGWCARRLLRPVPEHLGHADGQYSPRGFASGELKCYRPRPIVKGMSLNVFRSPRRF